MDSDFSSLMKKFSAMAAALIAAHGLSNAQVIINDINDSTLALSSTVTSLSMNIDLNNDGQADFAIALKKDTRVTITTYTTQTTSTIVTSYGSTSTIINTITITNTYTYTLYSYGLKPLAKKILKAANNGAIFSNTNYIKPLNSNNKILATQTFKNNNSARNIRYITIFNGITNTKGNFPTGEDKFIGVKFYDASNNVYLGWIKINILGNHSLKIEKWAYEQTADSIATGTHPYYMAVKDTTSDGATIAIMPKFNGKIHYVVIDSTATNPDWQQILNGTDGDGNPAAIADSVDITNAPDTTLINILGLSPDAPYRFCMISADSQGNKDRDVLTLDLRTKQATSTQTDELDNIRLTLYPNPAKDYFTIRTGTEIKSIEIFDLSGRKIKTLQSPAGRINISSLAPGVYSVRIHTEAGPILRKLIKY